MGSFGGKDYCRLGLFLFSFFLHGFSLVSFFLSGQGKSTGTRSLGVKAFVCPEAF